MRFATLSTIIRALLVLVTTAGAAFGRENGLFDIHEICLSGRNHTRLGCPVHHEVVVTLSTYFKSKNPGCNTLDEKHCIVKENHQAIYEHCVSQTVCEIPLEEPTLDEIPEECEDFEGETYVRLVYKCDPRLGGPRGKFAPMCSNFTYTGSAMYLTNKDFPAASAEDVCSCNLTITNETYVQITNFVFQDILNTRLPSGDCPQEMYIWTDYDRGMQRNVCSLAEDSPKPLNLSVHSRVVLNLKASRDFLMVYIIQVYHENDLTVTCQDRSTRTPALPPVRPTSSHEDPDTEDTNPDPDGSKTTAASPVVDESKTNTSSDIITPVVVSVVVVLVVIVILLTVGVLYLRHARKRDQQQAGREQTDRFSFENVLYDQTTTANGGAHLPNGNTRVAHKGIGSGQNGHLPYSSPLGAAGGARQHGAVFNQPDEKIHIYDHHENRPVAWPPQAPPGGRLSFRESKTKSDDQEPAYEELPAAQSGAARASLRRPKTTRSSKDDAESNTASNQSNVQETLAQVEPPPPPPTSSIPTLSAMGFPALDPRSSVSLISVDLDMTNMTHSTT